MNGNTLQRLANSSALAVLLATLLVASVFAAPSAAHSLSPNIFVDEGFTVNDSSPYSATFNTSDENKLDQIEVRTVDTPAGSGFDLYLEQYNESTGSWDSITSLVGHTSTYGMANLAEAEDIGESHEYRVRIEAADTNSSADIESVTVVGVASNAMPTADAGANQSVTAGDPVVFDASGSSDPDGDNLSYSWDFDGDGTEDATGTSPGYTFSSAGNYSAEVTVTDEHGVSDTDVVGVTVEEAPPTYDVSVDVVDDSGEAVANASVNLTDSNTTAVTDSNGSATFADIAEGTHNVTVTGPDGNLSVDETLEISENSTEFEVVLEDSGDETTGPIIGGGDGGSGPSPAQIAGGLLLVLLALAALVAAE